MDERTYEQRVQDTTSHFYPATPTNAQIQWEVDQRAQFKTPQLHRLICAWCDSDLGAAPAGCMADTHGICPACKEQFLKTAKESE